MSVPPRLAERLLEALVPPGAARDGALGDLHELYCERARFSPARARAWYWFQALEIAAGYTMDRLRNRRSRAQPGARSKGGGGWMTGLRLDLQQAQRSLRSAPTFSLVAVLTLALGIGGTVAIFSVVRSVLLRELPYPDADRLVVIWENDRLRGTTHEGVSAPDYEDFVARSHSFESLAGRSRENKTLGGAGEAVRVSLSRVTASYFPMLGVEPLLGRTFAIEEEQVGRDGVVLLSESVWRDRYGADVNIAGETIELDGDLVTIVGVMPSHGRLPFSNEDLWQPLAFGPNEQNRGRHSMLAFGRIAEGTSLEQAQHEMSGLMQALEEEYADENLGRGVALVPLPEQTFGDIRPALLVLLAAVCGVLLIACANVANLLLVRGIARAKELALRTSLGAGPWRLARLVLVESFALALAGGALGVILAAVILRAIIAYGPADIPRLGDASLDAAILWFALAVTLATALLFAIIPAWRATRAHPADALRQIGRRTGSGGGTRSTLVVAEVALASLLVLASGLLIRSFWQIQRVEPGYRTDGLLLVGLRLSAPLYPFPENWPVHDWPEFEAFTAEVMPRIERLPGVISAALAHAGPHDPGWTTRVTVDGRPELAPGETDEANFRPVGTDYFTAAGVPLVDGRTFTRFDVSNQPLVAVVNEAFARRHFPEGGSPIGNGIVVFGALREIVGVVADVRFSGLESDPQPAMYLPIHQNPMPELSLLVRTEGEAAAVVPELRRAIAEVDPGIALFDVTTAEASVDGSVSGRRFNAFALLLFASVALVLAAVGVYGVLAYSVAERTREMGVRMALGADPGQLIGLVVRQGMGLVLLALGLGFAGSIATGKLLESLLFGVTATDPTTFLSVAAVLIATALAACYLPARRATRIDPNAALRSE